MTAARTPSPVLIVGTGLLGASIGMGLRRLGVDVLLEDLSPDALRLAADFGAGRPAPARTAEAARPDDTPKLVIVCVPPDVTASVVADQLAAWPEAVVTDVASVKSAPLRALQETGADLSRYVGSHPMAGRETGGPLSGRADLFIGRPWVVAAHADSTVPARTLIEGLALDLGATVLSKDAESHDDAVALVSHVPQLLSSVMASQLLDDEDDAVLLAGGGLRDLTRIAASDPRLWMQILAANGPRISRILRSVGEQIEELAVALDDVDAPGSRRAVAERMASGNAGVTRLPGKHGSRREFSPLTVMVDDRPGQLGRLFNDIGEVGINIEELQLEHSPGANLGLLELAVLPEARARLIAELETRGWKVAE